ncbi:glycosyltransferase family 2 protein [Alkalihalobacterium elongatum]|uniref:glycosyltransferase family 2 protein n=1 Tax=Alkalihalobacterium elongatum TaxID=2675466 RepID=UPI001F2ED89A|nr:glycosyltransferase family 2 protein [Alkalihalobacterium elongatum]
MIKNVSILIPFQPDNGQRDLNFKWITDFYKTTMPEAELCIHITNDKLFNKSKAINSAAKKATRDIFVIADADMIISPSSILESIRLLRFHKWIIPFKNIHYLSMNTSNQLLKTVPNWPPNLENENSNYLLFKYGPKAISGGINIISRTNFNLVGGFDERFAGWGGEDNAFCYAVNTLCGPLKRLNHDIYHLWHPRIGWERSPNAKNNRNLLNLYRKANGNKSEMMELINS